MTDPTIEQVRNGLHAGAYAAQHAGRVGEANDLFDLYERLDGCVLLTAEEREAVARVVKYPLGCPREDYDGALALLGAKP